MLIVEPTQLYEVRHNIVQDLLSRAKSSEYKDLIKEAYVRISKCHSELSLDLINLTHNSALHAKLNRTSMTILKDYAEELIKTLDVKLKQH